MSLWTPAKEQSQPHHREKDDDEGTLLNGLIAMETHHPLTRLSMDSGAHDVLDLERDCSDRTHTLSRPPDINLPPLSGEWNPLVFSWSTADGPTGVSGGNVEILDGGLAPYIHDMDAFTIIPKAGRKCERNDRIWGAWFFFSFYFKPVFIEGRGKTEAISSASDAAGFDKKDLRLDIFLVQHDMENMYMWAFKDRPGNALGKMQLRSFMNGHSRHGEPKFPYSAEKGFVRSHRMQRKHYRGLSNPQCVHGIDVVRVPPDLSHLPECELNKWLELTGRDLKFSISSEASDFSLWRHLPNTDFDIDRPILPPDPKNKKLLNGSGLNLSNGSDGDATDLSPICNKRKKQSFSHGIDESGCFLLNCTDRGPDLDPHQVEPPWLQDFSGVMRESCGPVTAAKTIYEDEEGYLIVVSLPFSDLQKVKVSWRNTLTHGIVKVLCVSTARMPYIKRQDRIFKLTDVSPEHCPPGEFVREICLATRIPEEAKLEAYYDEASCGLEIMVPKHRVGSEEHEVRVCLRPHFSTNELLLS